MGSRRRKRLLATALALLVGAPEASLGAGTATGTTAPVPTKSMDHMSPAELDHFVQQLNESANWRKYRRPSDPPDFVPGKPVKLMHGAGSSFGHNSGMRGGSFRRSGLANRRGSKSGRGNDRLAQDRNGSRSSGSGSNSSSSFGNSSRSGFGSSSGSSLGSSRSGFGSSRSSFGNSGMNSFGQ